MKLHINTDAKTISMEGTLKVSDVFNHLMSWFPEDWEQWSFVPYQEPVVKYKEIIVERDPWRDPYWNPWKVTYSPGLGLESKLQPMTVPSFKGLANQHPTVSDSVVKLQNSNTELNQLTLNLNQI